MAHLYILRERQPVEVENFQAWWEWLQTHTPDCVVKVSSVVTLGARIQVVTAFVGAASSDEQPELFETRISGGPRDGAKLRCWTWTQAEGQHVLACYLALTSDEEP